MKVSDLEVGKQLFVGIGVPEPLGRGEEEIRGSAYIESPVIMGKCDDWTDVKATLMVAREVNTDREEHADRSLYVKGNTFLGGDDGTPYTLLQVGNHFIDGNYQTPYTLKIESVAGHAININNGAVWIDDEGDAMLEKGTSGQTLSERFAWADARPAKSFDIKHPSKEGWRLRYACIEGPEVAVYCRGRVKNKTEILLPNYWKDLVHTNSISVQLQPIGAHQDVIVKRWDDEKIYLQSNGGMPINCFYHVYAERKDINPLITQYEGDSRQDYPDPNHDLNKVSMDEQIFNDPRFAGPLNTITI